MYYDLELKLTNNTFDNIYPSHDSGVPDFDNDFTISPHFLYDLLHIMIFVS